MKGDMPRTEVYQGTQAGILRNHYAHGCKIGRILDELEKSGQDENTYIFFTADHGLGVGHHGLFGKQICMSTAHVFHLSLPAPASQRKEEGRCHLSAGCDADLIGDCRVETPEQVQFNSLMLQLTGDRKCLLSSSLRCLPALQRSVTHKGKKLILYPNVPIARLFDINEDPHEMKDLAKDGKNLDLQKSLFAKLLDLQEETGDTLDLKAKFPKLL